MKTQIHDAFGVWFFNFREMGKFFPKELYDANTFPVWLVFNFIDVLKIVERDSLLIPKKVKFLRDPKQGDTLCEFEGEHSMEACLEWIKKQLKEVSGSSYIMVGGETVLFENGKGKKINNIINISYDFTNGSLVVRTFTDAWVPIDLDDNLQIELAKNNAPRLEKALQFIKNLGYDDNLPDEVGDTEYIDEILYQKGFKVYMPRIYDYSLLNDLSEEDRKFVLDCLWENR